MQRRGALFNDERMQEFIRRGHVTVRTDFPDSFHAGIYNRIESILEQSGNPGNNLLPRVPEIQEVLNHPEVHGALSSVLGPSYYAHPHRYCHVNPPGTPAQSLHKDGYSKRHHRTRWVMAFYYPQHTPVEMGPTGVADGSQYFNIGPPHDQETPLIGEAGTVVLVNYDLWHRGTMNKGDRKRFMLKFLFTRLDEPTVPEWQSDSGDWQASDPSLDGLWQNVWNWHRGRPGTGMRVADGTVESWTRLLGDGGETQQFQAAYALGAIGESAVGTVIERMASTDPGVRRNAGYALAAIGAASVDALMLLARSSRASADARAAALDTLGDIGIPAAAAVPVVAEALGDAALEVRRAAADALGTMNGAAATAAERLGEALGEDDEWVCRNAALSLLRMGRAAEPATPALITALRHQNRYVRLKAAHALERIATPYTLAAALDFYRINVWCPVTDATTPF